ncbi:MAG: dockerin type I domain-containing protein [Eubacteriales bacterium]|nr:dockerin type I domain-containing protein [Eubacteriales bacterium]
MKRKTLIVVMISMLLIVLISAVNVSAVLAPMSVGNVDKTGGITVKDATLIQKYIANLEEVEKVQIALADVDADEKVTVKDATMIQKYCANIIDSFPAAGICNNIDIQSVNADFNSGKAMVGVPVTFMVTANATPEPITYEYQINGEVAEKSTTDNTFTNTFEEAGIYEIKVIAYNDFGTASSATIGYEVIDAYESEKVCVKSFYHNKTEMSFNTIETDTVLTATAMFGSGNYEYAFYVDNELVQDFSAKNTCEIERFEELREYTLSVKVRDTATGDLDIEDMIIVVREPIAG